MKYNFNDRNDYVVKIGSTFWKDRETGRTLFLDAEDPSLSFQDPEVIAWEYAKNTLTKKRIYMNKVKLVPLTIPSVFINYRDSVYKLWQESHRYNASVPINSIRMIPYNRYKVEPKPRMDFALVLEVLDYLNSGKGEPSPEQIRTFLKSKNNYGEALAFKKRYCITKNIPPGKANMVDIEISVTGNRFAVNTETKEGYERVFSKDWRNLPFFNEAFNYD